MNKGYPKMPLIVAFAIHSKEGRRRLVRGGPILHPGGPRVPGDIECEGTVKGDSQHFLHSDCSFELIPIYLENSFSVIVQDEDNAFSAMAWHL